MAYTPFPAVPRGDDDGGGPHGTAAGDITSGTFDAARIPTLAQSKVTNLETDLAAKAPLASPTFTGTPAAPTAAQGTNTTQVATTAFVRSVAPWIVIDEQTLGSGAGSVAWSTLGGYKEFRIVAEAFTTDTGTESVTIGLRVNGDTGANYDWVRNAYWPSSTGASMNTDSAQAVATTSVQVGVIPSSKTSTSWRGRFEVDIGSRTGGHALIRSDMEGSWTISATQRVYAAKIAGLWKSTSAITSLTVTPSAGNFATGSYFRLEGRA